MYVEEKRTVTYETLCNAVNRLLYSVSDFEHDTVVSNEELTEEYSSFIWDMLEPDE